MSKTRKLGNTIIEVNDEGVYYQQSYFINSADKPSFDQVLQLHRPADVSPLLMPVSEIRNWKYTPYVDHYVLQVNSFVRFDNLIVRVNADEINYIKKYYVLDNQKSSYDAVLKIEYPANVSPLNMPNETVIKDFQWEIWGNRDYILTVTALKRYRNRRIQVNEYGTEYHDTYYLSNAEKTSFDAILDVNKKYQGHPLYLPGQAMIDKWEFSPHTNDFWKLDLHSIDRVRWLESDTTEKGTIYTLTVYLHSTERPSYDAVLVYNGPADVSPLNMPAGSKIEKWSYNPYNLHWKLIVTAKSGDYKDDERRNIAINPDTQIEKAMGVYQLYIRPEWYGCRVATSIEEKNNILNIYGAPCKQGDFLFWDATPSSKGSPKYDLSPFHNPNANTFPISWINRTLNCPAYTVIYYKKSDFYAIEDAITWKGVNGTFGPGTAPVGYTQQYTWLAFSCKMDTIYFNNIKYYKLTRTMVATPNPGVLLWNPNKLGGVWTW